ncbi:hypothetical protein PHYSODRAFT_286021, partial [Phytophthora sojae]
MFMRRTTGTLSRSAAGAVVFHDAGTLDWPASKVDTTEAARSAKTASATSEAPSTNGGTSTNITTRSILFEPNWSLITSYTTRSTPRAPIHRTPCGSRPSCRWAWSSWAAPSSPPSSSRPRSGRGPCPSS